MFLGSDQILYVNTPEGFVRVAFVEEHTLAESTSFLSGVTRLTNGWGVNVPLSQSFTVSVRAVLTTNIFENDTLVKTNIEFLRAAKRNRELVDLRIETISQNHRHSLRGYISDLSETSPSGGFVRFTLNMIGEGEPVETYGIAAPDMSLPWTFDTTDYFGSAHTIFND